MHSTLWLRTVLVLSLASVGSKYRSRYDFASRGDCREQGGLTASPVFVSISNLRQDAPWRTQRV